MTDEVTHISPKVIKYIADDDIGHIHDYSVNLKTNEIYLFGEESYISGGQVGDQFDGEPGVEFAMANKFIKNLHILQAKSVKPILIHMKTNGGDWNEGMAIYNAIKACPNHICILNYTHARSMSSLILLAADKKVMMIDSEFMFHEGSNGVGIDELAYTRMKEALKDEKKTYDRMMDIYTNALKSKGSLSKKSRKDIKEWLVTKIKNEVAPTFTAKETVKLGFADEIFGVGGVYDWDELRSIKCALIRKTRINNLLLIGLER